MLDETARQPGFSVQLIPTFTHKNRGGFEYQRNLCEFVIAVVLAGDYRHVFWSVMNEFIHPVTHPDLKDEHILYLGKYLHDRTGLPVSTDAPGRHNGDWRPSYPAIWREFSHYCFHPPRNPEPTADRFKQATERWSKTLLYNETVKYVSVAETTQWPQLAGSGNAANMGRGTDADRQRVVTRLKSAVEAGGPRSRWFYHSHWLGIRCDPIGWIPR